MSLWPWVVALILISVGWEYAGLASSHAPTSVYATEVAGLLDYCSEIQATLEASTSAHQTLAGSVTSAYTFNSPLYSNYVTGPTGASAYTLQCWITQPLPAGEMAPAIIQAAAGNITVGTATGTAGGTTSQWTSSFQAGAQNLPKALQVGTVVVLTGY